ncbi:hypothetical protein LBMAG42_48230 [Deltaproteobacteria bacterium]|nr:hypothetical protein LBMAG42_48230 [Deltaproteobacteria bacterium]
MFTRFRTLLAALLAVVVTLTGTVALAGTPRRPPGSYTFGPVAVWTDGTVTDVFQPMSDPMPSASLVSARIFLEITEATATNLRTRPALRYSADGVGWDAAQPINTAYVSGNGVQAGTTFVDLTTLAGVTPKAWVQFGVQVKNNAQGNYEIAHTVLLVEPKGH